MLCSDHVNHLTPVKHALHFVKKILKQNKQKMKTEGMGKILVVHLVVSLGSRCNLKLYMSIYGYIVFDFFIPWCTYSICIHAHIYGPEYMCFYRSILLNCG